MSPIAWVIIVALVVLVVAALVWVALRNRRRAALQSRFGPEYDRMVETTGDQREAESRLADLAHRRDKLEIRDLDPATRARYDEQWDAVQARFVDEPGQAVSDADGLVTAVMRDRGYPVEDFDERAAMVATDHADVVEHYRAAHQAHARHLQSGAADTEDLRQAFVHYRSLYAALTGAPGRAGRADLRQAEVRDLRRDATDEPRADVVRDEQPVHRGEVRP